MALVGTVKEIWRYPVKSMGGQRLDGCTVTELGVPLDRGWALRDEKAREIRGAKKMPALMRCEARYVAEPTGAAIPTVEITLPDASRLRSDDAGAGARLSALVGREVTLWPRQPAEDRDHYRRGLPDHEDLEEELRDVLGRLPDEPLPDLSTLPQELFEFTSPPGTYFDAFPLHLLTTASLRELSRLNPAARIDVRRFRPNFLIETDPSLSGLVDFDWCSRRLRIGGATIAVAVPAMRCGMTTHAQADLPKDPSILRTIVRETGHNVGVYASVAVPGAIAVGDPVELL